MTPAVNLLKAIENNLRWYIFEYLLTPAVNYLKAIEKIGDVSHPSIPNTFRVKGVSVLPSCVMLYTVENNYVFVKICSAL